MGTETASVQKAPLLLQKRNVHQEIFLNLSFVNITPQKQILLKSVISLLNKPSLTEFELCFIELSLSSIYNRIKPAIGEVSRICGNQLTTLIMFELKGISEVSLEQTEEVIAIKDVKDMILFVCEKKRPNGQTKENIIRRVRNVRVYRRFAELLDILFNGTDIK
ncbi:hypothetical protein BDF21DRAFT_394234 [Thamnidium elegans]|nr:hypothetical protein BDF21DRAFT_394234 [Thamnidium elegans]